MLEEVLIWSIHGGGSAVNESVEWFEELSKLEKWMLRREECGLCGMERWVLNASLSILSEEINQHSENPVYDSLLHSWMHLFSSESSTIYRWKITYLLRMPSEYSSLYRCSNSLETRYLA